MLENHAENTVFSLSDIWLSYGSSKRRLELFRGLGLEVKRGEALALLGPSGEGKTVLLKLMVGLISPARGKIVFQGTDLAEMKRSQRKEFSKRIGMTFQKSGLFDSLSCADNLRFPLRELGRFTAAEREKKVQKALAEVELQGQGNLMVHEMSGGMQKRLGIARALVLSPEVIFYDNPTAGLDPITSRAIVDLIQEMKRKYQMTIVVVTSEPEQAYQIADRIAFLYRGTIRQIGTPAELRTSADPVVRQFLEGSLEGPLTQGGLA